MATLRNIKCEKEGKWLASGPGKVCFSAKALVPWGVFDSATENPKFGEPAGRADVLFELDYGETKELTLEAGEHLWGFTHATVAVLASTINPDFIGSEYFGQIAELLRIDDLTFLPSGAGNPAVVGLDFVQDGSSDVTAYAALGSADMSVSATDLQDGSGGIGVSRFFNWDATANPIYLISEELAGAESAARLSIVLVDSDVVGPVSSVAVSGLNFDDYNLVSTAPANGAVDVSSLTDLAVEMSGPAYEGVGSVRLYAGQVLLATIAAADCSYAGSTVTVPCPVLPLSSTISVAWDAGFVTDEHGNPGPELLQDTTLSFQTEATASYPVANFVTAKGGGNFSSGQPHAVDLSAADGSNTRLLVGVAATGGSAVHRASLTIDGVTVAPLFSADLTDTPSARLQIYEIVLPAGGTAASTVMTDQSGSNSWEQFIFYEVVGGVTARDYAEDAKSSGLDDLVATVTTGPGFVVAFTASGASADQSDIVFSANIGQADADVKGLANRGAASGSFATKAVGTATVEADHLALSEQVALVVMGVQ